MTDYTVGDTIYTMFTTRAFATGIPTVLAGTPVVSAYENDSAVQITAGITLGVSHDSVVGMNLLTIVASGANGYENGKDYNLVVTTGTVGGVSVVGEVVATFSIGRAAAAVDLANGTDGLGALKTETAAILVDTGTTLQAEVDAIQAAVITNAAGVDIAADIIALKAETATILVDTGTTLQAELDAIQAAVITNAAGVDIAADIIAVKAETATIVADTNELQVDDVPGLIAALNDLSAANVNTEVDNALDTAISELSQGIPTATPTVRTALMLMYMALRNKLDVATSATDTLEVHNDAGTRIAQKLLTDDGSDYSEAKMSSGA